MAQKAIYPLMPVEAAQMQYMTDLANITGTLAEMEREKAILQRQLAAAERKKRRRETRRELGSNSNGEIIINTWYDDGGISEKYFIMNARGSMQLYLLSPTDYLVEKQSAMIMINDGCNSIAVMCLLNQMKQGKYICQQMQAAGIIFNPEIPSTLICTVLEEWFLRSRNTAGSITSKVLHGWEVDDKKAVFWNRSPLFGFRGICDELGIRQAHFELVELTEERRNGYISELLQFRDHDTRLVMFLAPFIGLFKSLTDYFTDGQTFWINFITVSEIPVTLISSWIQVWDREALGDGRIGSSEKERRKCTEQLCDENMLVDIRRYAGESDYSAKTKRQTLAYFADLVKNQRHLPGTNKRISAALFSVSDCYEDGGALNIVLPDHDEVDNEKHRKFTDGKYLEGIMTAVVKFIGENYATAAQIFRKERYKANNENILLAITEILQIFFEREGIDIMEELHLRADFSKLLEADMDNQFDTFNVFADVVRSQIYRYPAKQKQQDYYEENTIYYDREYIYFPKNVLMEMYQNAHRGAQWKRALVQLRTGDWLDTSSPDTLTRKLQIGGCRHTFYAVNREFFDVEGQVDVLDLAREEG